MIEKTIYDLIKDTGIKAENLTKKMIITILVILLNKFLTLFLKKNMKNC